MMMLSFLNMASHVTENQEYGEIANYHDLIPQLNKEESL